MDFRNGLMEQFMRECGKIIKLAVKESLFILMVISMKATGNKIKLKGLVDMKENLEDSTKEAGVQTSLMVMESKIGEMAIFIKEILKTA